jgi:hypothetical protein
MKEQLLADAAVARTLSLSPTTIRQQRFRRRHNQPHWLTIDPVMIGTAARYRSSDVEEWLAAQMPTKASRG